MRRFGLIVVAFIAVFSFATLASAEMTNTCKFNRGPRAGQKQRYPQFDPIPVGSPCNDGNGSSGVAVSEKSRDNSSDDDSDSTEMTNTCKFNRGPRKGETQRYPDLDPIPVGTACNDGNGSSGIAISEKKKGSHDDDSSDGDSKELTNTCKFTSGPRKGQRQRYPDFDPIPVGSPCNDGKGSSGIGVSEKTRGEN